jgi:hypothetical protein
MTVLHQHFNFVTKFVMLLVVLLSVHASVAKDVKILNLSWMLVNGTALTADSIVTSSFMVPIAIKHWNERYDGILPLSRLIGDCSNTLSLLEEQIIDSGNSPNQAMRAVLSGDRLSEADIIFGPLFSKVRSGIEVAGANTVEHSFHKLTLFLYIYSSQPWLLR